MATQHGMREPHSAARQRGQSIFILGFFVSIGLIGLLLGATRTVANANASQRAKDLEIKFATVKEALIGWSASRTPGAPNARPGELPCPDIDNSGTDPGACVVGAIGRVPWRTLGIPEPKDSSGETLWYAISGPFRNFSMSAVPITSDTLGTLTVHSNPGNTTATATTLTTQAVAVIFAPGTALDGQNRSATTTMACAAPSGTVARNLCASNYLETAVGPSGNVNNATINGPFIQANPLTNPSFNDRLLVITNADLMPAVEQRVAREMMSLLEQYRIATGGDYPSADLSNGDSDADHNRHRLPCAAVTPVNWGSGGTPSLPNWLSNGCGSNGWTSVIFYAVSRFRLTGNNCTTCSGGTTCGSATTTDERLTITNPGNRVAESCPTGVVPYTCTPTVLGTGIANLLLITPGAATSNRAAGWTNSLVPITGYFDDAANADNDNGNCYVVPTSASHNRNRMYVSIP